MHRSRSVRSHRVLAVTAITGALLAGSAVTAGTAAASTSSAAGASYTCVQDLYIGNYCGFYKGEKLAGRGSAGAHVKEIQALINAATSYPTTLSVDGVFGPATESAVRWYQSRKGLSADGIVGPNTWGKLRLEGW